MNVLASTNIETWNGGLDAFAGSRGAATLARLSTDPPLASGEMVLGRIDGMGPRATRFFVGRRRSTHRRHIRKYAEGELPPDRSFYFRGPQGELNLRAVNLVRFCELAEGVDEGTWEYHRRRGEYSAWIREMIKDPELGREVAEVEQAKEVGSGETRRRLLQAIRRRYAV